MNSKTSHSSPLRLNCITEIKQLHWSVVTSSNSAKMKWTQLTVSPDISVFLIFWPVTPLFTKKVEESSFVSNCTELHVIKNTQGNERQSTVTFFVLLSLGKKLCFHVWACRWLKLSSYMQSPNDREPPQLAKFIQLPPGRG